MTKACAAASCRLCPRQFSLPLARGHVHNTPILNGRLYSAGGRINPTSPEKGIEVTGAVHVGTFRTQ